MILSTISATAPMVKGLLIKAAQANSLITGSFNSGIPPQDHHGNARRGQRLQGFPVKHLFPEFEDDHLRLPNFGALRGSDSLCDFLIAQGDKSALDQLCPQKGPRPLLTVNDPYDRLSSSLCQSWLALPPFVQITEVASPAT